MKTTVYALAIAALFIAKTSQSAETQQEGSDASFLFSKARAISAGKEEVLGSVKELGDCDLYYFAVPTAGTVTIRMESTEFDCNLMLFDAYGRGLWGDDDGYPSGPNTNDYDSEISLYLPVGIYYIACGGNNIAGYDNPTDLALENVDYIISNDTDEPAPTPTVERLYGIADIDDTEMGDYRLFFDFFAGNPGVRCDARSGSTRKQKKHTGNNKYKASGARQITSITTTKKKANLYFSCQNDSSIAGPIDYRPTLPPKKKFKTKVRDLSGGGNITAEVKLGQYRETFAPGSTRVVCVSLRKKSDKAKRAKIKFRTSAGDGATKDTAICKVKFE